MKIVDFLLFGRNLRDVLQFYFFDKNWKVVLKFDCLLEIWLTDVFGSRVHLGGHKFVYLPSEEGPDSKLGAFKNGSGG